MERISFWLLLAGVLPPFLSATVRAGAGVSPLHRAAHMTVCIIRTRKARRVSQRDRLQDRSQVFLIRKGFHYFAIFSLLEAAARSSSHLMVRVKGLGIHTKVSPRRGLGAVLEAACHNT